MTWLLDPLTHMFFARAVTAGVVVGALCGAIGVFVVLRRMSYIGHGLSHSVLGGVAVALSLGWNLYVGAAAATLLSAYLIDRVARRRELHPDAAIGIVTTAMFAIGVVVVSSGRGGRLNTEALLFGNILGVQRGDVAVALSIALVFVALLFAFYKPLVFTAFDPMVAAVQGVRVGAMELLFNVLVAAVIVVSVRVLGVLLIAAAVVIPAATARLVTSSFGPTLVVATAIGAASSVVGLYLSFWLNVASGASIVLVQAAGFAMVSMAGIASAHLGLRRTRRRHASFDFSAPERGIPRASAEKSGGQGPRIATESGASTTDPSETVTSAADDKSTVAGRSAPTGTD